MGHTKPEPSRRHFLRSTAVLGIISTLLPRSVIRGEKPQAKYLKVRRDHLGNPALPPNWKEGPKALDTPEFNPHGRSIPTIRQICRRKTAGMPALGYGVMGTVVELKKPIGHLPEDE